MPKARDNNYRVQNAIRNTNNDLFLKRNSEPFENNKKPPNATQGEEDYPLQFVKQFQATAKNKFLNFSVYETET